MESELVWSGVREHTLDTLRSIVGESHDGSPPVGPGPTAPVAAAAIHSLAIDHVTSRLLICRFDALFGALSVSLPLSESVAQLPGEWDGLL